MAGFCGQVNNKGLCLDPGYFLLLIYFRCVKNSGMETLRFSVHISDLSAIIKTLHNHA